MMPAEIWMIVGAVALMAAGAVLWGRTVERRREERFREAAETLRFTYHGKGLDGLPPGTGQLSQFALGTLQHVEHLMQGTANGIELTILDLASTSGLGPYQSVDVRSVAIFRSPRLKLPSFFTHPRALGRKLIVPGGMELMLFEEDETFDQKQGLSGVDAVEVKALFGPVLRQFMVERGPFNVEGNGELLVVYYSQLPLRAMPSFLEAVFPVYSAFRQACEARADGPAIVSAPAEPGE